MTRMGAAVANWVAYTNSSEEKVNAGKREAGRKKKERGPGEGASA